MFKSLFSPITIRGLALKNRVILPAMGTKFANQDRTVSQQLIDYHVARTEGGCGLNMVEVACVHTPSAPRKYVSLSEDKYIPGLSRLTDSIHRAGGKAGIQLWQGGLAVGTDKTALILLPSEMTLAEGVTLPGILEAQIQEVVVSYGAAAARAVQAGFDCVEIHGGHNYLFHSFLSPALNHRSDQYGGSFANRARFPLAVIRAVRANVPDTMPIFMRIDAHDDYLENGLTIEDIIAFCRLAGEAGVDVLDVSRGNILTAALKYEVPPIDIPRGFNIANAARIKAETGMLTVGVGRINDPRQADDIISSGQTDLVAIGRAQLADPLFCQKAAAGEVQSIIRCIGCNQGCYDGYEYDKSPHITCLRNPALGKEVEYALKITAEPKTVLIAGGGIAGLEAAIILKRRGHRPILSEAGSKLGGQFLLAGKAPRKEEMNDAALAMAAMAAALGVDIRLGSPVTKDTLLAIRPDALINAIGASPIQLRIPGHDQPFVVNSHTVLAGDATPQGAVVVIGGGLVGAETAEYLSERGCQVTILEMLSEVGADLGHIRKITVTENLAARDIRCVTDIKATEIRPGQVIGEKGGQRVEFPCDWVVTAVGSTPNSAGDLAAVCRQNGIAYFQIGDAAKARRGIDAIREAGKIARTFDEPTVRAAALRPKKKVFLTGVTGGMGLETARQLLARSDRFDVRALARPSKANQSLLKEFASDSAFEVVWGDMNDENAIRRCVAGADYVLHIGAFVSPAADKDPAQTLKTNLGSTRAIIKAIKAQPNPDGIKLAYIGTIAETGDRSDPIHWGRCGDPIKSSVYDYYAVSKIASEREVFESGLKYWVSLRQTGINPPKESAGGDPIIFHQPPNNVLEWITATESGIMMANLCEDWVPEEFWRSCYNIGGGKEWRLVNWEFVNKTLAPLGLRYEDVYDPRQMALYNFHGHWYTDSDVLNDFLRFRCITPDMFYAAAAAEIEAIKANPALAAMLPTAAAMRANNEAIGHQERGFHWMFETNQEGWIKSFFGSRAKQAQIKSFAAGFELYRPSEEPVYLKHGYDESKPLTELNLEDMKGAAIFRGGACLSKTMTKGDLYAPLRWRCAFGHEFDATPNLILRGGHWCPECERSKWNYAEIAKVNPFFAQVWNPIHGDGDEDAVVVVKEFNDQSV